MMKGGKFVLMADAKMYFGITAWGCQRRGEQ